MKLFAKLLGERVPFFFFFSSPGKMCVLQLGSARRNLNTLCSG